MLNPASSIAETLFPALARAVVVDPADLKVDVKHSSASSVVAAHPSPLEAGNLIGKRGRTVRAFKLVARLVGAKHGWPVVYDVQTPPGDNPPPASRPALSVKAWDSGAARALLDSTLSAFLHHPADVTLADFQWQKTFEVVLDDREPTPDCELSVLADSHADSSVVPPEGFVTLRGDAALRKALSTIFGAVGKLHGITVGIILIRRTAEPAEAQPMRADGKYAKEAA